MVVWQTDGCTGCVGDDVSSNECTKWRKMVERRCVSASKMSDGRWVAIGSPFLHNKLVRTSYNATRETITRCVGQSAGGLRKNRGDVETMKGFPKQVNEM